jgi:cyclophilin family peptidyl-prolyl cis-trans isomerase
VKKPYLFCLTFSLLLTFLATESWAQGNTMVRFRVSYGSTLVGNLDVELFDQDKPITVSNFLAYVDSGRFNRSLLHRLFPNIALLGGSGTIVNPYSQALLQDVHAVETFPAIPNEFNVGTVQSNLFGTIAMARLEGATNANTAQSTWFINLGNNSINQTNADLNFDQKDGGYTVFGRVVAGTNLFTKLNSLAQFDARGNSHGIIAVSDPLYAFYCGLVKFFIGSSIDVWQDGNAVPVSYFGNYCVRYTDLFVVDVFRMNGPITDVTPPTVALQVPAEKAVITDNALNVSGTAADNVGVSSVDVILNHQRIYSASGGPSWSVTVTNILPGTNTLTVVAKDAVANQSKPFFRNFFYLVQEPLHLTVQGQGTTTGPTDGQVLDLGRNYVLSAKPAPGYSFLGWTGTVSSTAATIGFTMSSNMAISAVFIPNPFIPTMGVYNGLFSETTNVVRNERAGYFTMKLTDRGTFTAKLTLEGKSIPFAGLFDLDGSTSKLITRNGSNDLFVALNLDITNGTCQVTGRVAGISSPAWRSHLIADQATFKAPLHSSPQAGLYTMVIPGTPGSVNLPGGDSYGTVKIDANGKVTAAGVLADNTKFSQKTMLSKTGTWPFFSSLYKGKGLAIGWLDIVTNSSETDIVGEVDWLKTLASGSALYPGFLKMTNVVGSVYVKPATATNRIVNLPTGTVSFTGGNLPSDFSNAVAIAPNSTVTSSNANKLTLTFSKGNGVMKGTAVHPDGAPLAKFSGVVLQKQVQGAGFFLGTNQTGRVLLQGN